MLVHRPYAQFPTDIEINGLAGFTVYATPDLLHAPRLTRLGRRYHRAYLGGGANAAGRSVGA